MSDPKIIDSDELFEKLGGYDNSSGFPSLDVKPLRTAAGTPYFREPGVVLVARPQVCSEALEGFLSGFDEELNFMPYLEDPPIGHETDDTGNPEPGANLAKIAGQLCYLSFGEKRTRNAEGASYLTHIKQSRHGSVLEHPSYTFLIYGVDRSFTHELVRHRVGVAFSQVSQRYVDGKTLRFVQRPEYAFDSFLSGLFEERIDRAAKEYAQIASRLVEMQGEGTTILSGEKRTELRKKVNQAARSGLPNETEAPIMFSGNVRALRHIIEMRADGPADLPIRAVGIKLLLIMKKVEPTLFDDYQIVELPDGTCGVRTEYRKV